MPEPAPLLLDTHVWLWVAQGARAELSAGALDEIEAASRRGDVLVSAISVWEVAMLESKGRISLSRPVEDWAAAALRAPGTRLLELSPEIAIQSTRLPGAVHSDPADRILLASARVAGGRLATRDRGIVAYGRAGHVGVLDVAP